MMTTAWLGLAFVAVGVGAALLMMRVWGFPYDEQLGRSAAPGWMAWLHRGLGYTFILILLILLWRMVPRTWLYQGEFSARSAIHAFLGLFVCALLLVKVTVVRCFPAFREHLPLFGVPLMLLALVTVSLPLSMAAREWRLSWTAESASASAAEELERLPGIEGRDVAILVSGEGLASGRRALLVSCTQCHDLRRVLTQVKTAAGWQQTVARMAEKAGPPGYRPIGGDDEWAITAYLTAIRGWGGVMPAAAPRLEGRAGSAPVPAGGAARDLGGPREPEAAGRSSSGPPPDNAAEREALAIFSARCVVCHSGPGASKGVRLDSAAAAVESGVIVPGDPAASELVRRVKGQSTPRMPLDGPPYLTQEQIGALEAWIASLGGRDGAAAALGGSAGQAENQEQVTAEPAEVPVQALPRPGEPVLFSHVQPVLLRHCVKCHTPDGLMGPAPEGLVLKGWEQVLSSPERPAVLPGQSAASPLLRHIRGLEVPRMPFDGPPWLTAEETELVARWIEGGAPDDAGRPAPVPVGADVRLRGRLESRWVIDGAAFRVTASTELRDIVFGRETELRARVAADGSLVADRVRGR